MRHRSSCTKRPSVPIGSPGSRATTTPSGRSTSEAPSRYPGACAPSHDSTKANSSCAAASPSGVTAKTSSRRSANNRARSAICGANASSTKSQSASCKGAMPGKPGAAVTSYGTPFCKTSRTANPSSVHKYPGGGVENPLIFNVGGKAPKAHRRYSLSIR